MVKGKKRKNTGTLEQPVVRVYLILSHLELLGLLQPQVSMSGELLEGIIVFPLSLKMCSDNTQSPGFLQRWS